MIELKAVTIRIGDRVLLEQATGTIYDGDKLGLVGRNGCGKTTMLALLRGKISADKGEVVAADHLDYAYLEQEIPNSSESALEYVKGGDRELTDLFERLKRAESKQDYEKVVELHNRLYELDADKLPSRASSIMLGLGFKQDDLQKPVNSFSGGWRMRLNLAKVLVSRSKLLFLDEPTNYLDIEAIWWLEHWLRNFNGTVVVISHDRDFLDRVVNRIWAIHQQRLEQYRGSYTDYQQQRAEKISQQQHALDKQQATIKHLTSYVERFRYKASKARQAQSRLKLLEKMERVEVLREESPYSFSFRESAPGGTPLLKLDQVDLGYGAESIILPKVKFALQPCDRVAILGANGAGKSTLLRSIAGVLPPVNGKIIYGSKVRVGYFAQHQMDQFDGEQNCYELIQELDRQIAERQIRSYLGGFGFAGDQIFKPLHQFSGGEKARFTLAWLIWQRPNLLLLDEPTNHLDLEMREALSYALQTYQGALLLVAHDRYLLDSSVDSFYEIYQGRLSIWDDDLEKYYSLAAERRKNELKSRAEGAASNAKPCSAKAKGASQSKHKLQQLEAKIANLEKQIAELNALYQQPGLSAADLTGYSERLAALSKELAQQESLWYQMADV